MNAMTKITKSGQVTQVLGAVEVGHVRPGQGGLHHVVPGLAVDAQDQEPPQPALDWSEDLARQEQKEHHDQGAVHGAQRAAVGHGSLDAAGQHSAGDDQRGREQGGHEP